MLTADSNPPAPRRDALLFWTAAALWFAVMVVTWPQSLSFGDEVGYIGQARLLLQGRVHPVLADPGIWHPGVHGLIPKYPLFLSLVIAPFLALSPSLVFLPGILTAIALAWLFGKVMESWGHCRLWGLIVLMDPSIVLLSRTVMADVALAFFGLATWYYLRRGAVWRTIVFAALTMATKTSGVVIVGSLLGGHALACWRDRRSLAAVARSVWPLVAGLGIGGAGVVALNLLSNGTIHSSYTESISWAFGLRFLPTSGVAHLRSLLICPPLLVLGGLSFWRRRDLGALAVVAVSAVMMSVYFFVDWGVGVIDSLVLSRRLILPVVVFLLVGYTDLLATQARRIGKQRIIRAALVALPAVVALAIGLRHRQWQGPQRRALAQAVAWTQTVGQHTLGLTHAAYKVGSLFPGQVVAESASKEKPEIVLCATVGPSYRLGGLKYSCDLPGYRIVEALKDDGYFILRRTTDGK